MSEEEPSSAGFVELHLEPSSVRAAPVCFSHSSWRGSSGAGAFSCKVAPPLTPLGAQRALWASIQESQAEVQSIMELSHLQHLLEEQM